MTVDPAIRSMLLRAWELGYQHALFCSPAPEDSKRADVLGLLIELEHDTRPVKEQLDAGDREPLIYDDDQERDCYEDEGEDS